MRSKRFSPFYELNTSWKQKHQTTSRHYFFCKNLSLGNFPLFTFLPLITISRNLITKLKALTAQVSFHLKEILFNEVDLLFFLYGCLRSRCLCSSRLIVTDLLIRLSYTPVSRIFFFELVRRELPYFRE